jgi:acetyl-CoA acetyltransferase
MRVAIVGIGIHPFGRTPGKTGMQQGAHAARLALKDAGVEWKDMQFGYGGSYSGGNADAVANELGLTGAPFTNIMNACATGGSSLLSACKEIKSGEADIGLVVGFDKHDRGAFNAHPSEYSLGDWYGEAGMMLTTQFFAMKLRKYMDDYGITTDTLARVAEKAYLNGALNPNAWRRTPIGLEEIKNSTMVNDPLTKYMFCSPSEGGVALVVCREDIAFAQLQDTEAGAEVMHMAENGFCAHGEQERMLRDGETRLGGRLPINTDGGCMANGEPIGASGLRQIYETVLQLRGQAGERQVQGDPKTGYTHVYGAPGISAVSILQR